MRYNNPLFDLRIIYVVGGIFPHFRLLALKKHKYFNLFCQKGKRVAFICDICKITRLTEKRSRHKIEKVVGFLEKFKVDRLPIVEFS